MLGPLCDLKIQWRVEGPRHGKETKVSLYLSVVWAH